MVDNAAHERLQPSLLDRLTDREPGQLRETRDERVIDIRRLREIVHRDLSWLLNTSNNNDLIDPDLYPHASRSVLKYGLHEVAGDYSTTEKAEMIRKSIRHAIEAFEPRIRSGTVDVELRGGEAGRETIFSFDIRADMWAEPVPMELYLRSEVDVTTGEISVERAV